MKKPSVIASRRFTRLFAVLASVTLLALTVAQGVAAELLAGVAANGRLVLFASDDPEDVAVVQVRGLQPGEQLLGLDVRPATGELYALGSSARLYTINFLTGQATAVSSIPFTNELTGTSFGFDFNPTVDRIRIVSNTGWNIRVNPTNGLLAAVDVSLAYAVSNSIPVPTPEVVASAYINNDTNPATATVLYGIDVAQDALVTQNPPNAGVLNLVGPLGVDATSVAGFDVSGVDGVAYAALVPAGQPGNSARAGLYTIDLATGAATLVGKIGGPKLLTSLATLGTLD